VIGVRQVKSISEKANRLAVRDAPSTPFQVADRACAQPSPLGQAFLREASCYSVSAKQSRE
jgi:hypothetical protein